MPSSWKGRAFEVKMGVKEPQAHLWIVLTEPSGFSRGLLINLTRAESFDPIENQIKVGMTITTGCKKPYTTSKVSTLHPPFWRADLESTISHHYKNAIQRGVITDEFYKWCVDFAIKHQDKVNDTDVYDIIETLKVTDQNA